MKYKLESDLHEIFASSCKAKGKWGIFLSRCLKGIKEEDFKRLKGFLRGPLGEDRELVITLAFEGWAVLYFDSEEETYEAYDLIDGSDTGGKVYALTCDPSGELWNENT